jgi:Fic family protein
MRKPALYLSDFFERNRMDYYEKLNAVRLHNRLGDWIRFFLQGIIETAGSGILTFQRIIALRDEIERNQLVTLGRKQADALKLVQEMYKQPVLYGMQIAQILDKHPSNANKLIAKLVEMEILTELTGYSRNRMYAFRPYIELFS